MTREQAKNWTQLILVRQWIYWDVRRNKYYHEAPSLRTTVGPFDTAHEAVLDCLTRLRQIPLWRPLFEKWRLE